MTDHPTPRGLHPASRPFRFLILITISLMLFGNYFAYDITSVLGPRLMEGMGITEGTFGLLYSFYSWPNMVTLLIAGLLIDRLGTRTMSLIFSSLIVVGTVIVATAPTITIMIVGRAVFGIGAESLIVCQSAILAKWFKGRELAFAFGLSLTFMRLGTIASFNSGSWIADAFEGWRTGMWVAVGLCVVSLIFNIVYVILERNAHGRVTLAEAPAGDKIVLSDIKHFGASFWLITALCVTFYSAIFPFTAFSTDFFMEKWGLTNQAGGSLTSLVITASMILAPILGGAVDRFGRRGTMMMVGSLLLVPVYLLFGLTMFTPVVPVVLLGLAFSLVPAAMWPAVPLVVNEKHVGTAFGLMTMVQNWGLGTFPLVAGTLRTKTGDYTASMLVFATLGLFGFLFAILLKRSDAQRGHVLRMSKSEAEAAAAGL
jgi:predicted MFS family arabinose efflux permease